MIKYVEKKFLGNVSIVEEDGYLVIENGDIPVEKGQIKFKDQRGQTFVMSEKYFQKNYVEVELVEDKHKFDRNELANGYAALSELNQNEDQDYINGMEKLVKDKAF